jgi:hypothetical protein
MNKIIAAVQKGAFQSSDNTADGAILAKVLLASSRGMPCISARF